jgi:ubiquitin carboxyl-terminal hydrolase 10
MSHLDPSGVNEASRQTLIVVLPPLLVIHLKRFLYDPAAVKIGAYPVHSGASSFKSRLVRFPSFLPLGSIPDGLVGPDIMVHTTRQSEWPARYALYGLLYHHSKRVALCD